MSETLVVFKMFFFFWGGKVNLETAVIALSHNKNSFCLWFSKPQAFFLLLFCLDFFGLAFHSFFKIFAFFPFSINCVYWLALLFMLTCHNKPQNNTWGFQHFVSK